jgi:hypothetical protein
MTPEKHRAKAERIERSLRKCAPGDYEIRIGAAVLASTHWLNMLFHAVGASAPHEDVMHTYMLTVNDLRRYRLVEDGLIDCLSEIEDLRPAFVRGNWAGGERAADRALELLDSIRARATARG